MAELKRYFKKHVREAGVTLMMLTGVLAFRSSVAEPYKVPTGSMEPTILPGDYLMVSKAAYGFHLPFTPIGVGPSAELHRGDVVVFKYPVDPSVAFVKRLVGLPGDVLRIEDGRIELNGEAVPLDSTPGPGSGPMGELGVATYRERLGDVIHSVQRLPHRSGESSVVRVPEGMYFFMGDNRDNSADSRRWGFVKRDAILGKAVGVWLSLDWTRPGRLPHLRWDRFGKGL